MDIVLSTHSPAKLLNFYKTFGCYSSIHKRAGSLAVISTKEIKVNNGKNEHLLSNVCPVLFHFFVIKLFSSAYFLFLYPIGCFLTVFKINTYLSIPERNISIASNFEIQ